ncbi:hypothetical protein PROFUN_06132 [Planoprotostelium fungivorum]|uniref:Adenosine deaminase domain-containing protein n=1 Tax=Planoprotostelium fungivorum TaxID=1890364 RepID=A0A2P6NPN0_9EUKA|nr:hypothetical protein PROFUN_06132 [Planoprotostelium fungivorum]
MITSLEQFKEERASLVKKEREERFDSQAYRDASQSALLADDVFKRKREKEKREVWADDGVTTPQLSEATQWSIGWMPGTHYHSAREQILESDVFRMMKDLPKGCLLHLHFDGSVPTHRLLTWTFEEPLFCIKSSKPLLTLQDLMDAPLDISISVAVIPIAQVERLRESLKDPAKLKEHLPWSSSYVCDSWCPLDIASSHMPAELSKLAVEKLYMASEERSEVVHHPHYPMMCWIYSVVTLSPHDVHIRCLTPNAIWKRFQLCFGVLRGMTYHGPFLKRYIKENLSYAASEHIYYQEFRVNFLLPTMTDERGENSVSHDDWMDIFQQVLDETPRTKIFWGYKIIFCTIRSIDRDMMRSSMDECIRLKLKYPNLICGFDMVGQEDKGHPLSYFEEELWQFKRKQIESKVERYIKENLSYAASEHIYYQEFRVNFLLPTMTDERGENSVSHDDWMDIFQQVLDETPRTKIFWGYKIIFCTIRSIDRDMMRSSMDECIRLKLKYPNLICGFDMVGQEDKGHPLSYFEEELWQFKRKQIESKVEIPFVFHAGETLDDGGPVDHNLYDAIAWGTKRIGHGFSLYRHPHLMRTCHQRNIAVECCPISNELLRLTSSILTHPLSSLLANDVPLCLNSDDPSIFTNVGLSFDYFQLLIASESTSLIGAGELGRRSIEYSLMDDAEKEVARGYYEELWEEYCRRVCDE